MTLNECTNCYLCLYSLKLTTGDVVGFFVNKIMNFHANSTFMRQKPKIWAFMNAQHMVKVSNKNGSSLCTPYLKFWISGSTIKFKKNKEQCTGTSTGSVLQYLCKDSFYAFDGTFCRFPEFTFPANRWQYFLFVGCFLWFSKDSPVNCEAKWTRLMSSDFGFSGRRDISLNKDEFYFLC